jgi:hypothetical protein
MTGYHGPWGGGGAEGGGEGGCGGEQMLWVPPIDANFTIRGTG